MHPKDFVYIEITDALELQVIQRLGIAFFHNFIFSAQIAGFTFSIYILTQ